ncbi:hypothetical protein [Lactiplantibacillus plantarum]|uniref:hypothetical protein n=1 Tax=Lactiplantibacillus plantarum TaxID=1590 RepID=UPI001AAE94DC|nr:hypothetical protein [Lactiplantibacillus plantarum]MBO2729156.1 hypothetical protein [Lactiplantibacillus plantarum]
MEKTYRTKTYGEMPLKLDTGKGWIFPKGVEVKAHVDLETGQVSFFIAPEDLDKVDCKFNPNFWTNWSA